MVLNNVLCALRVNFLKPALPEKEASDLGRSPEKSTFMSHVLHDPRIRSSATHNDVNENGRLRGKLVPFDLSTSSILINPGIPLDRASVEVEIEQEGEAVNDLFDIHAELIRTASVLFVRFLYTKRIKSNAADACPISGGCETLNFKLHNGSFTQLHTPDDEDELLVKAYLFGYSYSCWTFCNAVIDTLICKVIDERRTPVLRDLLNLNSNRASCYPLKMLIGHLAVYTWSEDQFSGFSLAHKHDTMDHVRFWADVGDCHAMHKTNSYGLPKAPWRENPCHYHVHASYPKMNYTCYDQRRQG
ncbi:hypothetical protein KCU95_g3393, partial [Aureobasidium melanogenum]